MSLIDTVEPDAFRYKAVVSGSVTLAFTYFEKKMPRMLLDCQLYSRATVESLLAEWRKQALLEVADKIDYKSGYPMSDMYRNNIASELRRMAEGEK